VVVLSPEFVHQRRLPRELQIFLDRKARDPDSIAIIPVFLGLTEEQCDDLEGLYHSQPWPPGVPQPSEQERAQSLEEWAEAVEQLRLQATVAKSEEVGAACVSRWDEGVCRVLECTCVGHGCTGSYSCRFNHRFIIHQRSIRSLQQRVCWHESCLHLLPRTLRLGWVHHWCCKTPVMHCRRGRLWTDGATMPDTCSCSGSPLRYSTALFIWVTPPPDDCHEALAGGQ
jgi:hypothetical protein